ncbi:MAG: transporter [Gammaproteobacteria bacterium]|jgi:hypothetical protein
MALATLCLLLCDTVDAQELTPRAFWPLPNGTNVLSLAYQYSSGDILVDPSLPLTGVDSKINYLQVSYQRTFSLYGRTAGAQLSLPYSRGTTRGFVDGVFRDRDTVGLGDARLRLAVNLLGAPTMDPAGMQKLRSNPRTIVGASLLIQAPTGEYAAGKVVNIGTNRWSVKPAVGVIVPLHPTWLLEFEAGVWFFEDNDDFLGQTREQKPILSTEAHLIKRIRPGFWASLDANFYVGGRTRIDGGGTQNLQRNSRLGATVVVPFKRVHALRGSFSTGATTNAGGDYEIYNLSYLYAW